jgi:hypothetical protein
MSWTFRVNVLEFVKSGFWGCVYASLSKGITVSSTVSLSRNSLVFASPRRVSRCLCDIDQRLLCGFLSAPSFFKHQQCPDFPAFIQELYEGYQEEQYPGNDQY